MPVRARPGAVAGGRAPRLSAPRLHQVPPVPVAGPLYAGVDVTMPRGLGALFGAMGDPRMAEALALWNALSDDRRKKLVAYAKRLEAEQRAEQAKIGPVGWGPPL